MLGEEKLESIGMKALLIFQIVRVLTKMMMLMITMIMISMKLMKGNMSLVLELRS